MAFSGLSVSRGLAEPGRRIRDLGVEPGIFTPGPLNAITDVQGVRVGHRTLIEGDSVRTGVTAILPHPGNLFRRKTPAAVYVANGFGKAAGFLQVRELGILETPIVLTNTLSVGTAVLAVVRWTLEQPGNEDVRSVNAVVGETNDGLLNDIRGLHVHASDVVDAIEGAKDGPVEEGCVGAGTGTRAFGWKGGIGTASRRLPAALGGYTVGALVQTNFGGVLTIDGVRVGEKMGQFAYRDEVLAEDPSDTEGPSDAKDPAGGEDPSDSGGDGSCMMILATDAPLSSRNLERMARRAPLGLARTGSFLSNGSGDFVIAFSTQNLVDMQTADSVLSRRELRNEAMSPLFLATVEAVEEAVYNSLVSAVTMTGRRNRTVEAIPLPQLEAILHEARKQ